MDRAELVERLREAGVPEAFYEIAGVPAPPARPDAHYFLRRTADAWTVGLSERSQDSVVRRFATETDACAYLYDTLTQALTPPAGEAAPLEELLADGEEIQRQAWEDFERVARNERDEDADS
ncbi:hypothetical protein [Streptomyces sp. HUAS TT20]|uniref:hypothetical protein n=1 Tax=Streptomyces sp. HUAS TT20 TaxID=3447509 RepID=UPI0021D86CA1|nr:hypothetical protein [Streptomyces sp. HUAS 15-9]UXY31644.1 hypothetical protein N8I87_37270 [Streptomyces sp. HUAS 15-9]